MESYLKIFILMLIISSGTCIAATDKDSSEYQIFNNSDEKIVTRTFYKSPGAAVWRSFVFPGLGQIYVENYWKSPIFATAAGVLWYSVIDNTIKYNDFKQQLKNADINSPDFGIIKSKRDNAVDSRDLTALYLLGVYVIAAVDAYVEAHLFDFSVNDNNLSEKLSFSVQPMVFAPNSNIFIKLNISWRL